MLDRLYSLCFFLFLLVGQASAARIPAVHRRGAAQRPGRCIARSSSAPSPSHSTSSPASPSATPYTTVDISSGASSLIPNGIKAGIAGGDAYPYLEYHIGWFYDWTPNPSKPGRPVAVSMLWGAGTADPTDAARLAAFEHLTKTPRYLLGPEEPDCSGSGSSGISVAEGVALWDKYIAPMGRRGALLGSPSMCKQADETWLKQFRTQVPNWDFTAVHINKNSLDGAKEDIEYYWNTYGKPIWVTEFACVDDRNGFRPCTDQGEIDAFINAIVPFLENHPHVMAYAYSNGLGLGDVWPLMRNGALSPSGQTYLAAISKFH